MRQRLQFHGLLKEHVVVTEGAAHDEEVIRAIANGDPRKERLARALLGSDEEFAPLRTTEPSAE